MKYFIVMLAVVGLAMAHAEDDWKVKSAAEIKAIREECLKEGTLNEEQIEKLKKFEFPDEEPVRKHLLCSVKKLGIFCEHEGYHADRVAQQFKVDMDEAEVLAIAKECADKNEEGSSADVWAYRGNQCLVNSKIGEHVKAHYKAQLKKVD